MIILAPGAPSREQKGQPRDGTCRSDLGPGGYQRHNGGPLPIPKSGMRYRGRFRPSSVEGRGPPLPLCHTSL